MNFTHRFKLIVIFITLFSVACGSNSSENNETEIADTNDPYNYIASVGKQDVSISGSEFQVTTDNCGATVSAKETLARSRSFDIRLEADVTTSLGGEFEGDLLVAGAKVQTAIETSLGIQIGTTETVNADRTLETPADNISIVTLQWEELWSTGYVNIIDDAGELKGMVPFRVLTTLRLSQKSVEEVPCSESTISDATSSALLPTPTEISLPLRYIPIPITKWGNDNIQEILPKVERGEVVHNGVKFLIPEQDNKVSTECGNLLDWPTKISIDTGLVKRAENIYFLINAGYTQSFAGKKIGTIEVNYRDSQIFNYDLTLGENIREWRFEVEGTVGSANSPLLNEVYRGLSVHNDQAALDMLAINIPENYHNETITSITVKDLSQELYGSANPCFHFIALTIEARD